MRIFYSAAVGIVVISVAAYATVSWSEKRARNEVLKSAQAAAKKCNFPEDRITMLPQGRYEKHVIAVTGLYFDPYTRQKDIRLACLEKEMAVRVIPFADKTSRGIDVSDPPEPLY